MVTRRPSPLCLEESRLKTLPSNKKSWSQLGRRSGVAVINHAEMVRCGLKWERRDRLNIDVR